MPSAPTPAVPTTRAARFAYLTLACFILVVLWGAIVRTSGSGAGCGANWPLCNGDFFPHHPRLATLIEFIHRSTSGICTLLDLALIAFVFRATPRRHPARTAVLASFAFLILEAALGAVLVLRHYVENNASPARVLMQSIHFTNTLLLMASLALTAWFLSPGSSEPPTTPPPTPRWTALLAILSTILVGATGSLAALADTLFPSPTLRAAFASDFAATSPLLIRMRWLHPAAALLAALCVLPLLRSTSRLSRIVLTLLLTQFALGLADILLLAPAWMQIIHLLGADLYWIALVQLAAQTLWPIASLSATEARVPHPSRHHAMGGT
jgi:cytochrome c oxidase assembly protein subunit 15